MVKYLLGYWIIFWTAFLDHFFCFCFFFFAVYQYSEGVRGTFVTEGGVEDELLVRRKGWEGVY